MKNSFKIPKLLVRIILISISLLSSAIAGETTLVKKLEYVTDDSLRLTGWFIPGSYEPSTPLLVLLHMYQHDHSSFDPFLVALNDAYVQDTLKQLPPYPHTLAFDLRGHGASTSKGSQSVHNKDYNLSENKKIPSDIAFALRQAFTDTSLHIDTSQVMIIGASVGANAAELVTEKIPNIKKIVLLSHGERYLGLEPIEALKKYQGKTLVYTCKGDVYSYESSVKLSKLAGNHIELKVFESSSHGTNIIKNNKEAMQYLLEWLLLSD